MKLTIQQVYGAMQALDAIIRDKRPMPQLGKYRLARLHAKLAPEFTWANAQRDELIRKHGETMQDGQFGVPPERMAAFLDEWDPIATALVDVDVEPVCLGDLALGPPDDPANGAVEASELVLLGDLVAE